MKISDSVRTRVMSVRGALLAMAAARLAVILIAFTWLPALAKAQGSVGIEALMRQAQDRYALLGHVYEYFPGCCESCARPLYPPDGYYGVADNEELLDDAAEALREAVSNLVTDFLADTGEGGTANLTQGLAEFQNVYFVAADFPELEAATTRSEIITACDNVLKHLHLRPATSGADEEYQEWEKPCEGDGGGPGTHDTCELAVDAMLDCMAVPVYWAATETYYGAYEWRPTDSTAPGYELTANFDEVTHGTDPSTYGFEGAVVRAVRARYSYDAGRFRGTAHVYLKLFKPEGTAGAGAPCGVDETFYHVTAVSLGGAWSGWVASNEPHAPEGPCPSAVYDTWGTSATGMIIDYTFSPPSDDVACDDETDLELLAAIATTAPVAEGSAGSDDCGNGGSGSGGGASGAGGRFARRGGAPAAHGKPGHTPPGDQSGGRSWLSGFPSPQYQTLGATNPSTPWPVSAAYGDKLESTTDVSVRTRWGDFTITRDYSSKPDIGGSTLVGEHWALSAFQFVSLQEEDELMLDGWPLRQRLLYTPTGTGSLWSAGGATAQTMDGDRSS